jgi:hypothetical protein
MTKYILNSLVFSFAVSFLILGISLGNIYMLHSITVGKFLNFEYILLIFAISFILSVAILRTSERTITYGFFLSVGVTYIGISLYHALTYIIHASTPFSEIPDSLLALLSPDVLIASIAICMVAGGTMFYYLEKWKSLK